MLAKQARSKHKITGGGGSERVAHINSLPRFGPSVKAYFLVHVRSLHWSSIPFVLVSNFPFVLTLTKSRTCLGYRSWKICQTIAFGSFFDSDCFFDFTRLCVTFHGFTHDKSVSCLFSTCLDFFFGGCCEDIVRLSIQTRKNLSFTLVQ